MTSTPRPTEFQAFQSLARRILTTPKAELMKGAEKPRPTAKKAERKKKG